MSNFENLKKQAKQIVRWHRERHWPVAAQIRSALPAYASKTDSEILNAPFQLADAQQLVAHRHGAQSWAELKQTSCEANDTDEARTEPSGPNASGAESSGRPSSGEPSGPEPSGPEPSSQELSASTGPDRAKDAGLSAVQPMLFVADVDRSCTFFHNLMGFEVRFRYGDPPFFAQIARGPVSFSIRQVDAYILEAQRTRRAEEELLAAMVDSHDIKGLYQEYLDAGVPFFQELRTEPWGSRSFIVQDPDGNLIAFGEGG